MRIKTTIEGKTKDVAITDVTPENYIVPSNEQHLYHCVIEVRKFDSETGKRLSVPRIQKFGKKSFENSVMDALKKQGFTITVLHDPNEYIKAQSKKKAALTAEQQKAALKAEIMAELKAEGIIPTKPVKKTKADAKAKDVEKVDEKKADAKSN